MTLLYRLIYTLVVDGLLPWLHAINQKVSQGYQLRQPQNGRWPWLQGPQQSRPYWIHCASGEFEYALPVIREMKKQDPSVKILVTYFTPTYVQKIKDCPLVDMVFPSPWDKPHILKDFIAYHQPRALLFSRTDVWFEMTRQCHRHHIPVLIFSMTVRPLSFFKKIFYRWRWQFVDQFFVVSESDKKTLEAIVPTAKIKTLGDSRYDQCLHRLQEKKQLPLTIRPSTKPLLLAGSTWKEDETILLPVLQKTRVSYDWILVPHENHTAHIHALTQQLASLNIPFVLASQTLEWSGGAVLIFDKVGFLAELYPLATASFIGGSFRKQVHSVMESLACGCLTFVGPFYDNNREAVEFSQSPLRAVRVVSSTDDLIAQITDQVPLWTAEKRQQFLAQFQNKLGASAKLTQEFFNL